jgi:1-deoxy-D-xylulose-5-phosphate reductoisomerase
VNRPLQVAVLGATGSIGTQALEVIEAFPEEFSACALAAGRNLELLAELIRRHRPRLAAVAEKDDAERLGRQFPGLEVFWGEEGQCRLAAHPGVDVVLAAVVGQAGLKAVLEAARAGKKIALANKEALVMAGGLVRRAVAEGKARLLPVDSEHAAAHQLLAARQSAEIRRLVLTASGGPFYGFKPEQLRTVTRSQALAHPRWRMGAKISIDSATLMNKGFEIIEASWLFELPLEKIDVLIHPASLAHALVELCDGSLLCQLAPADMRIPIAYALAWPGRLPLKARLGSLALELERQPLGFFPAREEEFPALRLCREALRRGGGTPAALSAADEELVQAFLRDELGFCDILAGLEWLLEKLGELKGDTLEEIQYAAGLGRRMAREWVEKRS